MTEGYAIFTEDISDRLLRLPIYFDLSEADLSNIVNAVVSFQ